MVHSYRALRVNLGHRMMINMVIIYRKKKRSDYFKKDYAWSVPNKKAILKIKEFAQNQQILEVGSGLGLWACLLKEAGVDIKATDDLSWM
jgi:hypothetical protein